MMTDILKPTQALVVQEATLAKAKRVHNPGRSGNNLMTPRVIGWYKIGNVTFELSLGEFMGDTLIGVTLYPDPAELSRCCFSLDELRATLHSFKEM